MFPPSAERGLGYRAVVCSESAGSRALPLTKPKIGKLGTGCGAVRFPSLPICRPALVAGRSTYGGSGARLLTRMQIGKLGTCCGAAHFPSLQIRGAAANSDPNIKAPTPPRPTDLLPPRPLPPAARSSPGNQSQITSRRFYILAAVRFERFPEGCALAWYSDVFKFIPRIHTILAPINLSGGPPSGKTRPSPRQLSKRNISAKKYRWGFTHEGATT